MSTQSDAELPIHVVTGWTEAEWNYTMMMGRLTPGWEGLSVEHEPRMHGHPALGIRSHGHGSTEEGRTPHTHRRRLDWDTTPIPIRDKNPEGRAADAQLHRALAAIVEGLHRPGVFAVVFYEQHQQLIDSLCDWYDEWRQRQ